MRELADHFTSAARRDARTRSVLDELRRSIAGAIEEAGTVDELIRLVTKGVPIYLRLFVSPIVRVTLRLLAAWVSPDAIDPVG